jgi:hypothetical protein
LKDGQFLLPFLMIYLVGVTVTWLIEMYIEGRQLAILRDADKTKEKF